jgi:membrane protease YdiL (CAAX protease family)
VAEHRRFFRTPRWLQRRDPLGRLAFIAALIAMSIAVITAGAPFSFGLPGRWYGLNEVRPIQGDILYRGGLAIEAGQRLGKQGIGIDPESFMQSGMEIYERLALRRESPNAFAMYRLAVIYSKRGSPDEGVELLEHLMLLDEERTHLYSAVSSVYDPKEVTTEDLRTAAGLIHEHDDWIARLVLADCYRRIGDEDRAARVEEQAAHRDLRFGTLVGLIALLYGLFTFAGSLLVLRFLYVRIFRVPIVKPWKPLTTTWSALDALEVAAVLLFAMVFVGLFSGALSNHLAETDAPQWVTAVIMLLSYLAFCAAALVVMSIRAGCALPRIPQCVGLGGRPRWPDAAKAMTGYSVMVALVVALAIVAHFAGVDYTFPSAQSAVELLQQLTNIPAAIIYFVLICAIAPALEEIIFRGFIYAGLRQRFHPSIAILLSAFVFGVTHIRLAVGGMVAIACVGVLLALLYERSRTLWPSIIAHAAHNILAFAIVMLLSV